MEKFDEQFRREMLVDGRQTFEEVLDDEVQLHVMFIGVEEEIAQFSDRHRMGWTCRSDLRQIR